MISEKTVELNLTTELINWFFAQTRRTHYVLAPSSRDESMLGFDALTRPVSGFPATDTIDCRARTGHRRLRNALI